MVVTRGQYHFGDGAQDLIDLSNLQNMVLLLQIESHARVKSNLLLVFQINGRIEHRDHVLCGLQEHFTLLARVDERAQLYTQERFLLRQESWGNELTDDPLRRAGIDGSATTAAYPK